jgi:hypothetical protein
MINDSLVRATPWDVRAFGFPCWEILQYTEEALSFALRHPGHFTIKVDPTVDKKLLHDNGFYYCDTLIEPLCRVTQFREVHNSGATISRDFDRDSLLAICKGAFVHGRFHRDFNLPIDRSDVRYTNWLDQLIVQKQVFSLNWQGGLGGFIGYDANTLVLHAVDRSLRGRGLSKYWWSAVCRVLFDEGLEEIRSSISAANLPVLNLYASIGFRFHNPMDVYHRLAL